MTCTNLEYFQLTGSTLFAKKKNNFQIKKSIGNITCGPSNYTMDNPQFIVPNQKNVKRQYIKGTCIMVHTSKLFSNMFTAVTECNTYRKQTSCTIMESIHHN